MSSFSRFFWCVAATSAFVLTLTQKSDGVAPPMLYTVLPPMLLRHLTPYIFHNGVYAALNPLKLHVQTGESRYFSSMYVKKGMYFKVINLQRTGNYFYSTYKEKREIFYNYADKRYKEVFVLLSNRYVKEFRYPN